MRVIAVSFLIVVVIGCSGVTPGKRTYTREEFNKAFLGATLAEVRSSLGTPADIQAASRPAPHDGYWMYNRRTTSEKGKLDEQVILWYSQGRVSEIQFQ